MTHVMACIDNSQSSLAVCDYAAWASQRLSAPLTLLHVLDMRISEHRDRPFRLIVTAHFANA